MYILTQNLLRNLKTSITWYQYLKQACQLTMLVILLFCVYSLSRYVTDTHKTFESDDSDLSDFIDDGEAGTAKKFRRATKGTERSSRRVLDWTDKNVTSSSDQKVKSRSRKGSFTKTRRLSSESESESDEKDDAKTATACRGSRKGRQKAEQLSSDNPVPEENNGSTRRRTITSSEDESSCEIKRKKVDKRNSSGSSDASVNEGSSRKFPKRTKSAEKQKKEALLAKMAAKRKFVKVEKRNNKGEVSNDRINIQNSQNMSLNDTEAAQEDHVVVSGDLYEEGDSDRDFVVEDDDCDSESLAEFFNTSSRGKVKINENTCNYRRICILDESDGSDSETVIESSVLDIFSAVNENNIDSVNCALQDNPSIIHEIGVKRRTLLHQAIIFGSAEITELLLSWNADTFVKDSYSLQPFAYALLTGHIDCLRVLVKSTDLAQFNKLCKVNFNFNMLHLVVYGRRTFRDLKCEVAGDSGLVQCLRILFDTDKTLFLKLIDEKDSEGFTPLVAAVIVGHSQVTL